MGLRRFELNETEKSALQSAVIKMQKDWAKALMMANPSKGNLVAFDEGLLASPPKGLEYGYVPIAVKQYMSTSSAQAKPTPKATSPSTPVVSPSQQAPQASAPKNVTITCSKGK